MTVCVHIQIFSAMDLIEKNDVEDDRVKNKREEVFFSSFLAINRTVRMKYFQGGLKFAGIGF